MTYILPGFVRVALNLQGRRKSSNREGSHNTFESDVVRWAIIEKDLMSSK